MFREKVPVFPENVLVVAMKHEHQRLNRGDGCGTLSRIPDERDCSLAQAIAERIANKSVSTKVVPQCPWSQVEVERPTQMPHSAEVAGI